MQTKRILGIALVASLVASMSAVAATTAFARETIPADENYDVTAHNFSVVGDITGDWQTDVAMSDEDGDGVFEAVFENVQPGTYEFKVRADADLEDSWGDYEEEYDRTFNSHKNCKIVLDAAGNVKVAFDTTGEDPNLWKVKYDVVVSEESAETSETEESTEASETEESTEASETEESTEASETEESSEATPATPYEIPYQVLSIIGAITGDDTWQTDVDMNDDNGDGVYEATIENVQPGKYEFKVRADHEWGTEADQKSWGVYEEDYERTRNSQTNLSLELEAASNVTVAIDVTGDIELWPVTITYTDAAGEVQTVYTGAPKTDVETSETSETSEEASKVETSENSEESKEESKEDSKVESEASETSEPEYYVTTVEDYIFFDNTETKWEKVCAYWFGTNEEGYTNVVDLFNRDYNNQEKWPGTEMKEVTDADGKGTGIWQILKPFNATTVIFNNGHSDEEVIAEWKANKEASTLKAYQTTDVSYTDGAAEAGKLSGGMIYKVTGEPTVNGRAANSLKFTYSAESGSITKNENTFNSEQFGTKPEENHDVSKQTSVDSNSTVVITNGGSTNGGSGSAGTVSGGSTGGSTNGSSNSSSNSSSNGTVNTGNIAMAVTFAAVAAAALGAVVLSAKKKSVKE